MNIQRQKLILNYWFPGIDEETVLSADSPCVKKWFARDPRTDKEISDQFKQDVLYAATGAYNSWRDTIEGTLALVIVLNQFPRHIYRNKADIFDYDLKALECCFKALKLKLDQKLPLYERQFLYMPLIHSENAEIQEMSLMYFQRLQHRAQEEEDINLDYYNRLSQFAQQQYDIIKRFRRYPHRNEVLKRRPTSEERAFTQQPEPSFLNL